MKNKGSAETAKCFRSYRVRLQYLKRVWDGVVSLGMKISWETLHSYAVRGVGLHINTHTDPQLRKCSVRSKLEQS
jgi:hypothetical protein